MPVEQGQSRSVFEHLQKRKSAQGACDSLFNDLVLGRERKRHEKPHSGILTVTYGYQVGDFGADILREVLAAPDRHIEIPKLWQKLIGTTTPVTKDKNAFYGAYNELLDTLNDTISEPIFGKKRDVHEKPVLFIDSHASFEFKEAEDNSTRVELTLQHRLNAFEARVMELLLEGGVYTTREMIDAVFEGFDLGERKSRKRHIAAEAIRFLAEFINRGEEKRIIRQGQGLISLIEGAPIVFQKIDAPTSAKGEEAIAVDD